MRPGTVIMTGVPSGVGFARRDPVFLKEGDAVEVIIGGIGTLTNGVVKRQADSYLTSRGSRSTTGRESEQQYF